MFKFIQGRKKIPKEPLASLGDLDFLKAVRDLVIGQDPGGWTMIAVAIVCKVEYVAAFRKLCERRGVRVEDVPNALDLPDLINEYWKESKDPENSSEICLRSEWLYLGAIACYASERAGDDEISQSYLLDIWLRLLRGCLIAPAVLKKNILWNEEEKDELLMKAPRGTLVATAFKYRSFFPKHFRFHPHIVELTEEGE